MKQVIDTKQNIPNICTFNFRHFPISIILFKCDYDNVGMFYLFEVITFCADARRIREGMKINSE